MLKMMILGRRRGGMTVAQHHRYMTDVHGAMVVGAIAQQPGEMPQRYVHNHVYDATFRAPKRSSEGFADPLTIARDFVTQVWFSNPQQARASTEAAFYREQLQPDEDNFVDQSSVVKLPVSEQTLFDNGAANVTSKLFIFHRCKVQTADTTADKTADTTAADLAAATGAHWQTLLTGHGIERIVRNTVMGRPGELHTVDLIDEVWLSSDAAAAALAQRWQTDLTQTALSTLCVPGSGFFLLAHERVMFAGGAQPS